MYNDSNKEQENYLDHFHKQLNSISSPNKKIPLPSIIKDVQRTAFKVLQHLQSHRQNILESFDTWLLPHVEDVLAEISKDTEELKNVLESHLSHPESLTSHDWIEHAKAWTQLYAKWYDTKHLTDKVLKIASQRTHQLIEKDIKMIHDYQSQSLAQLPTENDTFQDVRDRLKQATEESLKALHHLKKNLETIPLKQASEWMATVHQERESQFDTLLVKIDTIMKEVVYATPAFDFADFHELENEAAFIEKELKELAEIFAHLQQQEEETRRYLKNQLNGIQDHLNQFDLSYMPLRLKQRFDLIHQHVNTFLDQLQKF